MWLKVPLGNGGLKHTRREDNICFVWMLSGILANTTGQCLSGWVEQGLAADCELVLSGERVVDEV